MNPSIQKLIQLAEKEVGTRESGGNNRGTRIEEYQRSTWLAPGPWPWCAAFCCWLMQEWLEDETVRADLHIPSFSLVQKLRCRDASAFGWEKWAKERQQLRPEIQILPDTALAKAGDFVVFDFSHIGIVAADQEPGSDFVETIEGNTNGKGERDSDTGDGVWRKRRKRDLAKCYIRIIP